ncbi:hypothetical protein KR032_004851 [Drosophila birchii]|nr:hypothetical protein KR032_004851 [Drosophila birchii]
MTKGKSGMKTKPQGAGDLVGVPVQMADLTPEWEDVSHKYPMPIIGEETEYTDNYGDVKVLLANLFDKISQDVRVQQVSAPNEWQGHLIKERDLAYHKLICIEQILADAANDEQLLATRSSMMDVLKEPMEDEVQAAKGDTADFTLHPQ